MNHSITKKQLLGLLLFFILCMIPLSFLFFSKKDEIYPTSHEYLEKELIVGVNDYDYVAISNQKLATIYYTEYLNLLSNNPKEAYKKLDADTKDEKFKNYDEFLSFCTSNPYSYNVSNVSEIKKNEEYIFTIFDENKKTLTITSSAVMNYTVSIR